MNINTLKELIRQAVQAPSSHNTQPWRFCISLSCIDLYADRTRALPVNDPEDRELTISCGCALMNLRVAAAHHGLAVQVQRLPEPLEPDLLARGHVTSELGVSETETALSEFIEIRRTYRKRFEPRSVGTATLDHLIDAADAEGAWLRPLLCDEARQQVAILVSEGDAAQWANPAWRRELAAWMHPRRRGEGLTVPGFAAPVARLIVRSFDMGGGIAAKDKELAEASPLIAVLGTERDAPGDWLVAGQALQRVLLTACRQGLQASYLNQPVQVPSLRSKLQTLTGSGHPQIVLRLGHPSDAIPPAPRRQVDAVVEPSA